jgi:hypothetical protein
VKEETQEKVGEKGILDILTAKPKPVKTQQNDVEDKKELARVAPISTQLF